MQCLGPFYSISMGTAETLIDTVTQCIARVQYSCTLSMHAVARIPGSEFSEPVQTQTVGYLVLSGTRENTKSYMYAVSTVHLHYG